MRLLELASLAGVAVPKGSEELEITGVASLQEARPGDITFFGNPRYLSQLRSSKASVAIVPADFSEELGLVLLRVENPPAFFALAVAAFAPQEVPPVAGIHHSASVAASARIGDG
ncbi:MAG: LpxD N-terminal domain-containing protein, partial [bacterium]